MNGTYNRADEMAALKSLLDVCGADQTRWPAAARERFRPLLAEAPEARALVAEARAFDRVLDQAPRPTGARTRALADRIVAAAVASEAGSQRPAASGGRVIALPLRITELGRAARAADRDVWRTAALLAACLIAGVYLGAAPIVKPVVEELADSLGVATELDLPSYALFDESLEEDTL